jgi:hypothetical protein
MRDYQAVLKKKGIKNESELMPLKTAQETYAWVLKDKQKINSIPITIGM